MTQPLAVTITAVAGQSLPVATHLALANETPDQGESSWRLRGIVSHTRYTTADELKRLNAVSPPLGRPEAACAPLIAIRKSAAWWSKAQDERRVLFEEDRATSPSRCLTCR